MDKITHPTYTSQVLEYLRGLDDFATAQQIRLELGIHSNQTIAALHILRNYHAADCLSERGKLFWYARPPKDDTRQRVLTDIVDGITRKRTKTRKLGGPYFERRED